MSFTFVKIICCCLSLLLLLFLSYRVLVWLSVFFYNFGLGAHISCDAYIHTSLHALFAPLRLFASMYRLTADECGVCSRYMYA